MADAEDAPIDTNDGIPRNTYRITWRDLCHIFLSGFVILIDCGLDIYLAMTFKDHKEQTYFILTLVFLIVPSVIMTVLSLIGYFRDVKSHVYPKVSVFRRIALTIFHLLLLAPIWRCAETLILGTRVMKEAKRNELSKRERDELEKHYHRAHYRLSSMKLLEAFLEGCPQLVLQTYILINKHDETIKISIKICISLLSVAISMMNYHEKKRWDEPHRRVLHGPGIALQFLWYLFTLLSRIIALATLAVIYVTAFYIVVPIHWILMFIWIQYDKNKSNVEDNILHNIAVGGLYIFNFVKQLNQPMKWHYVIYYTIVFCEGLATMLVLVVCHNLPKDHTISTTRRNVLISIFCVSFALGITFMLLHYRQHPSVVHRTNKLRIVFHSDPNSTADSEKTVNELSSVKSG